MINNDTPDNLGKEKNVRKIQPLLIKDTADNAKADSGAKKRHVAVTILLVIWTIVKTAFVTYAVIFTLVATYLLHDKKDDIMKGYEYAKKGQDYFYEHVRPPYDDVMALTSSNPIESAYMTQTRELLRKQGLPDTLSHKFVPLDSISKQLIYAVLAAEDDGFYIHPGYSLSAIIEALEYNQATNSNKRGASTITQQLAKNLFLTPDKSFERKFKEIGYTLLMEKILGKDRILELYLNYAQWGKNVFGCEAAANLYFNKSCANLTTSEAVRMASCLAMPTRITPLHTKSGYMGKRIMVIANNMYIRKRLDAAGYIALTGMAPPGYQDPEESEDDIGVGAGTPIAPPQRTRGGTSGGSRSPDGSADRLRRNF